METLSLDKRPWPNSASWYWDIRVRVGEGCVTGLADLVRSTWWIMGNA